MREVRDDIWMHLLVSVSPSSNQEVMEWNSTRPKLPEGRGELTFSRDWLMEERWSEEGYYSEPDGEGPFAIFYEEFDDITLDVEVTSARGVGAREILERFKNVRLCQTSWNAVTLVTANDPVKDPFSRRLIDRLQARLGSVKAV